MITVEHTFTDDDGDSGGRAVTRARAITPRSTRVDEAARLAPPADGGRAEATRERFATLIEQRAALRRPFELIIPTDWREIRRRLALRGDL